MSRQEVIEHIGTIAKSGTREFLAALTGDQRQDAPLIGQFGVGFYSAFIVADRVTLTTRRAGLTADEGVRWESDGRGAYTLEAVERPDRGTTVVLHLREGEDDLLSDYRLRTIIQKYSDHISLPIVMPPSESRDAGGERGRPGRRGAGQPGLGAVGAAQERDQPSRTTRSSTSTSPTTSASRWPGCTARSRARYEYTLLLFIPSRAPFDLWIPQRRPGHQAVRQARLHHGRRRAADAAVPAVRPRRDRLEPTCR